jgi:hypothetical protein
MSDNNQPSIDQLLNSAEMLKFIGDKLLSSTFDGYECAKAWDSIKFVESMFKQVDNDIKNHPDFEGRLNAAKEKRAAIEKEVAAAQPKMEGAFE